MHGICIFTETSGDVVYWLNDNGKLVKILSEEEVEGVNNGSIVYE